MQHPIEREVDATHAFSMNIIIYVGSMYVSLRICVHTCTFCYPVSPGDYNTVINQLLVFNVGDERVTHTITINQGHGCEDDPYEDFISSLALESGKQPITVIRPLARVIITGHDTAEPECG